MKVDLSKIRQHKMESKPYVLAREQLMLALRQVLNELGFPIVETDCIGGLMIDSRLGIVRLSVDPAALGADRYFWCYWKFEDRVRAERDSQARIWNGSGFFNGKCNFYDASPVALFSVIRERLSKMKPEAMPSRPDGNGFKTFANAVGNQFASA